MLKSFLFKFATNNVFIHVFLLAVRLLFGLQMCFYGWNKMQHFTENASSKFWAETVNFLGLGGTVSMILVVFSELICSAFFTIGLFTRLALIPLIITMLFIVIKIDGFEIYTVGDHGVSISSGFQYLVIYVLFFFTGPGKFSLDRKLL